MENTEFKRQQVKKLARLLSKGYLQETRISSEMTEDGGKARTLVEMTFKMEFEGVRVDGDDEQQP